MAQRICSNCGHVESEYTFFCTECGARTIEHTETAGDTQMNERSVEKTKQKQMAETGNIQDNQVEIDGKIRYGNSSVRPSDSQGLKNKGIIIGLVLVIGVLMAVIIVLAASKENSSSIEVTRTSYDDDNQSMEDTVVDDSVEEHQYDNGTFGEEIKENAAEDEEEMPSYFESEAEDLELKEQGAGDVSDEGINSYELIVADVTWSEAFDDCISRGGHLVRITTDDEYQAVLQQIYAEGKDNIKFWIAGARNDDKDYHWVYEDGSYSEEIINRESKYEGYWLENEPSFYDDATQSYEDCMNMFYIKSKEKWVWNDVPDDILEVADFYSGTIGYICEYE